MAVLTGPRQGKVVIESPYAGDVELNVRYAKACMEDSLSRGEAPFASHLLYTQVLDDTQAAEREQGIRAGFEWGRMADKTVVYTDLGISPGMERGVQEAHRMRRPVEERTCPPELMRKHGVPIPSDSRWKER